MTVKVCTVSINQDSGCVTIPGVTGWAYQYMSDAGQNRECWSLGSGCFGSKETIPTNDEILQRIAQDWKQDVLFVPTGKLYKYGNKSNYIIYALLAAVGIGVGVLILRRK